MPITGLTLNQPLVVADRNVTLSGTLSDGSTFSNLLDPVTTGLNFDPEFGEILPGVASVFATVTVTLVESNVFLGDCDLNGEVNFSDIPAFVAVLAAEDFLAQADCNEDGVVNFGDIPAFVAILISQ